MSDARLPLPALEQHTLDNGLRVVLAPDPTLPLVAVNLWYHVGSRHERPGQTGYAHLFEHMLFQGSQHVGTNEHFAHVQRAGGVANGSTWYDRTNYYETLPERWLELGLWLESDRMGFLLPALTAEKLETQRQVVMNERRQRVDNQPYGRAFERLHELLYPPPHPYHWPVLGYMPDLEAATLDDVRAFYRRHYGPDNAVLTLCGRFEPPAALDQVARYFGDLDPRGGDSQPPEIPTRNGASREVMEDEVELTRIYLGFRVDGFGSSDYYAAEVLATALASGRSSPLYHDLVRERELAQDVGLFVLPSELEATVALTATCRPGVPPETLERALWDHLESVARSGIDEADRERAAQRILTAYFSSFEALDRRADLLSQLATYRGDPARLESEPERYLEVDADRIRHLAGRDLSRERCAAVTVVPGTSS